MSRLNNSGGKSWFQSYLYGIEISKKQSNGSPIRVSIVPLWNWNCSRLLALPCRVGFNRTFMELKLTKGLCRDIIGIVSIVPLWNWNRQKRALANRRELFQSYLYGIEIHINVCACRAFWRFNRTFMELKYTFCVFRGGGSWFQSYLYGIEIALPQPLTTWNSPVSIVPLWNWNSLLSLLTHYALRVSIVPLWNWNALEGFRQDSFPVVSIVPLWNWNMPK